MTTTWTLFVGTTPRLEGILEREVRALGYRPLNKRLKGGLELRVSLEEIWDLAHRLRLAETLRIRIKEGVLRHLNEISKVVQRLPWAAYFPPNARPKVEVIAHQSKLYHTKAVASRVERAVAQRLAKEEAPVPSKVPLSIIHLRIVKDWAQWSIDVVGKGVHLLHRRGYRKHVGQAPIRETLAAACHALAGYPPPPYWDPFGGSGTMILEALDHFYGRPFALQREFGFQAWPIVDVQAYQSWLKAYDGAFQSTDQPAWALISDIDPKAIRACQANVHRHPIHELAHLQCRVGDFESFQEMLPSKGTVLSNLPYGKRWKGKEMPRMWRRFGRLVRQMPQWSFYVLNGHPRFKSELSKTGIEINVLHRFKNRGQSVEFLELH